MANSLTVPFRPGEITTGLQGWWKLNEPEVVSATASGTVQIDTAQSVFGGASGLFSGSGDLTIPDSPNWYFRDKDFTIEFRVRFNTVTVSELYHQGTQASGYSPVRILMDAGQMSFYISETGSSWAMTGLNVSGFVANTWYAIALVRKGDTFSVYVDGALADSETLAGVYLYDSAEAMTIGRNGTGGGTRYHDGWLDEYRISNIARYDAAYTPAGSAFTADEHTLLLLHMDGSDASTTFTNSAPTTRADSSGNGNHLTDNNTVGYNRMDYWREQGESSADFERSNSEFLSIVDGSQTGLDLAASDFTMAFFTKLETLTGDNDIIGKGASGQGYLLRLSGGSIQIFIESVSNVLEATSAITEANRWHHVAVTFNNTSNEIVIYLDGNVVKVGSTSNTITNGSASFFLGKSFTGTDFLDGLLKDLAIWSVVLTPLQIKSLALGLDLENYTYRPENVSTPPTAWWKLNEISSGAGAVSRADSSGNGHTLTDNNTVTTLRGYIEGAAAQFTSGNSEYLTAADSADWDFGTGDFTLGAWIYSDSWPANCAVIDRNATSDFTLYIRSSGTQIEMQIGGGAVANVSFTFATGTWYHVMAKRVSGVVYIFIDGKQVSSQANTTNINSSQPVGVGAYSSGGNYFNGKIQDACIWKGYALTDAEISSLASGLPIQQSAFISHWPMDEASGTRADDINDNDWTENNGVPSAAGLIDDAADFNGSNEYFTMANARPWRCLTDEEITFGIWHNFDAHGSEMYLLSNPVTANNFSIAKQTTSGGRWDLSIGAATNSTVLATVVGTWELLLITKNGTNWIGASYGYDFTTFAQSGEVEMTGTLYAARQASGILYFDGRMDEMYLIRRGLRAEERKAFYIKGLNSKLATSSEEEPDPSLQYRKRGMFATFPV